MGMGFVKRAWILRVFVVQVFLAEVVRKSAGFLTAEDILDAPDSEWQALRLGRKAATEKLKSSPSDLPIGELGRKMTGERSSIYQYVYHRPQDQLLIDSEEKFTEEFIKPLYSCINDVQDLKISRESHGIITGLITSIQNQMTHKYSNIFMDDKRKSKSSIPAAAFYNVNFPYQKNIDFGNLDLVDSLQSAWNLLIKTPISKDNNNIKRTAYSIMFRLNDILLKFFLDSAQIDHSLENQKYLNNIFNGELGAQMIVNYIWGKFPFQNSITSAYANFDFQQSLESSPFLQELAFILKYVNKDREEGEISGNWGFQRIARLYLALQVKAFNEDYGQVRFEGMEYKFFHLTSPKNMENSIVDVFDINIKLFLKELVPLILSPVISSDANKHQGGVIRLKIYHNMLRFLVEYHIRGISEKNQLDIRKESYFPQIEALDAAIMFFSQSINSLCAKCGQIAQQVDLVKVHSDKLSEGFNSFIFLADNKKKSYIPLLEFNIEENPVYYKDEAKRKTENKIPIIRLDDLKKSWNNADYDQYFQSIFKLYLGRLGPSTPFTIQSIMQWNKDYPMKFCHDILAEKAIYSLNDINAAVEHIKVKGMDKMNSVKFMVENAMVFKAR